MSKYVVTSSSHFQPFSYDELVKPLDMATEAQLAANEEFDKLSMETSALKNYITDNPGDRKAKEMYDSYSTRLKNLQDDLWNNGYSAQTMRNLSAARRGYSSDIARLSKAVEARQARQKEYYEALQKDPTLLTTKSPGSLGLDAYLGDDNAGTDWKSYSGASLIAEGQNIGKSLAQQIYSDPRYRVLKETDGQYYEQVLKKGIPAEIIMSTINKMTNGQDLRDGLETLVGEAIVQVFDASGIGNWEGLDDDTVKKALQYIGQGMYSASGTTDLNTLANYAGRGKGSGSGSSSGSGGGSGAAGNLKDIRFSQMPLTGKKIGKYTRKYADLMPDYIDSKQGMVVVDGQAVQNRQQASSLMYSEDLRNKAYNEFGFDIGRDPRTKGARTLVNDFMTGQVYDAKSGTMVDIRLDPFAKYNGKEGVIESHIDGKWLIDTALTNKYRDYRKQYEDNVEKYKDSKLMQFKPIDPDEQYRISVSNGIKNYVPVSTLAEELSKLEQYKTNDDYKYFSISEPGSADKGKIGQMIADRVIQAYNTLTGTADYDKDNNRTYSRFNGRSVKGEEKFFIHEIDKNGQVNRNPVRRLDDIFKFDKGTAFNVNNVEVTEDAVKNGYIIISTDTGKRIAVGLNLLGDLESTVSGVYGGTDDEGRHPGLDLLTLMRRPDYLSNPIVRDASDALLKEIAYTIRMQVATQITKSESGTLGAKDY